MVGEEEDERNNEREREGREKRSQEKKFSFTKGICLGKITKGEAHIHTPRRTRASR
jgi:hypothetical protein